LQIARRFHAHFAVGSVGDLARHEFSLGRPIAAASFFDADGKGSPEGNLAPLAPGLLANWPQPTNFARLAECARTAGFIAAQRLMR
jgi:hypothetical protein